MKFKIKKDVLLSNLSSVSKAISTKNLIPILSGIKFDLTEEGLYLTCSDNDIMIQSFINKDDISEIEELGSIVISGRYVVDIIRKLPNEDISLDVVDGLKILINTTNSSFTLNGMNASDFPKTEFESSINKTLINKKVFKNIINQTGFAASTQESRPLLTGINFKVEKDVLECLATDSYRLAKKEIKLNEKLGETISVVIPSNNVKTLISIFDEDEDDIEVNLFSNKVIFKFDNITFKTKILSGTYPDTSKLIPEEFLVTIDVDTTEFYNVIDRASLLNNDRDKNIINLEVNGDEMLITSVSQEIGKVEERMVITKDNNENIKISFSARFMLEAIKALQCETMQIMLNGDVKPIILKEKDGDKMTQLILPIKTY